MSLVFDLTKIRTQRFPRVSGDEPVLICCVGVEEQFSPRERG